MSGSRLLIVGSQFRSSLTAAVLCAALLLLCNPSLQAKEHVHYGDGFSIDLDQPFDRVIGIVKDTIEDGVIRGTSEYKGGSELDGASPAEASSAFPKWTGNGKVFFKVRAETIAPDHFRESADIGTVIVRYVVESLGPKSTRLRIDATFEAENHHRTHPSDSTPENAEFLAISDRLQDILDREQKQRDDAVNAVKLKELSELQTRLENEKSQLKSLQTKEQELKNQISALKPTRAGQVKVASADVKAAPYNESKTLVSVTQGESLTVLQEGAGWYRVQLTSGQQGWVYGLMLQVAP